MQTVLPSRMAVRVKVPLPVCAPKELSAVNNPFLSREFELISVGAIPVLGPGSG